MSYYVNYDSLLAADLNAKDVTRKWSEDIEGVSGAFNSFSALGTFTGKTADAVRSYIQEIHGVSQGILQEILANYYTRISIYAAGYLKNIDTDNHAVLPEWDLYRIMNRLKGIAADVADQQYKLQHSISRIQDLVSLPIPSSYSTEAALEDAVRIPKRLDDRISTYESAHKNDFNELDTMIHCLNEILSSQLSENRMSVTAYQSGDISKLTDCSALMGALQASMQYRQANMDALKEANETEALIIEELKKEAADARLEQGIWSAIAAVGAITVGVVAIVATAGAATPAVVAGAFYVAGSCSVAYGISNLYEAGQDIEYGALGDPYTAAFNPLRDTLFLGNQQVYDVFGTASMTVAGLAVPVNTAYNAAHIASTTATMGSIGRVVAVEVGKDALAGAAGGYAGQWAAEMTGNERFGTIVGIGTGIVASVILGKVDEKFNISGLYNPDSVYSNKQAKEIINNAENAEPDVTATMHSLEGDDSHLVGLEHRIKGEDSLTRKIYDDAINKGEYDIADAPDKIGDGLRYTLIADDDSYEQVVRNSVQKLEDQGYTIGKFKNYWDDDTYKGINVNVQAPDGTTFELQFHTEQSFNTKEVLNHKYYEIARNEAMPQADRDMAVIKMQENTSHVQIPDGALNLHY